MQIHFGRLLPDPFPAWPPWRGMKPWEALPKSHILNTRKMYRPRRMCPRPSKPCAFTSDFSLWREALWDEMIKGRGGAGWQRGENCNWGGKGEKGLMGSQGPPRADSLRRSRRPQPLPEPGGALVCWTDRSMRDPGPISVFRAGCPLSQPPPS